MYLIYPFLLWPSLFDQVASFGRMQIEFKSDDRSVTNERLVMGKNQSEAERLMAEK